MARFALAVLLESASVPMTMLKLPAGVEGKRPGPNPHVPTTGNIVKERTCTHGRIGDPASEVEQSVRTLSGVGAGIASVRGGGVTPKAYGAEQSAKQQSANGIKRTAPQRRAVD